MTEADSKQSPCTSDACVDRPDSLQCLLSCTVGYAVCQEVFAVTRITPPGQVCDKDMCDFVEQCKQYGVSLDHNNVFACCRPIKKTAVIVGCIVGGVVALILIVLLVIALRRQSHQPAVQKS